MSDTPSSTRIDYTAGIGIERLTACPHCHLLFDTEVEAYTKSTAHGTQAYPNCPLKRIYGYWQDEQWVEVP